MELATTVLNTVASWLKRRLWTSLACHDVAWRGVARRGMAWPGSDLPLSGSAFDRLKHVAFRVNGGVFSMGATDLKLRDNGAANGGVGLKALSCRSIFFAAGRFEDKAQAGVAAFVGSQVF